MMAGKKENVYILTSEDKLDVYCPETNETKTICDIDTKFSWFNTLPIEHNGTITWARIPYASPNTITLVSYDIATSITSTSEIPII